MPSRSIRPRPASLNAPWSAARSMRHIFHRAVATRYDKLSVRFEATVLVAAINEWL